METGDFSVLKKKYGKGVELRGKTLVIVGFGKIGQSLATYALGCGMDVKAVDIYTNPVTINLSLGNGMIASTVITPTPNLNDVIGDADYISLHVPKQADGSAVIAEAEFKKMKKGVRIVNAARGGVVDEDALLKAIADKQIAAVGLDVFENEPNPRADLLNNEAIATTPHIGAATNEAQDRIGTELAETIIGHFGTF